MDEINYLQNLEACMQHQPHTIYIRIFLLYDYTNLLETNIPFQVNFHYSDWPAYSLVLI